MIRSNSLFYRVVVVLVIVAQILPPLYTAGALDFMRYSPPQFQAEAQTPPQEMQETQTTNLETIVEATVIVTPVALPLSSQNQSVTIPASRVLSISDPNNAIVFPERILGRSDDLGMVVTKKHGDCIVLEFNGTFNSVTSIQVRAKVVHDDYGSVADVFLQGHTADVSCSNSAIPTDFRTFTREDFFTHTFSGPVGMRSIRFYVDKFPPGGSSTGLAVIEIDSITVTGNFEPDLFLLDTEAAGSCIQTSYNTAGQTQPCEGDQISVRTGSYTP